MSYRSLERREACRFIQYTKLGNFVLFVFSYRRYRRAQVSFGLAAGHSSSSRLLLVPALMELFVVQRVERTTLWLLRNTSLIGPAFLHPESVAEPRQSP